MKLNFFGNYHLMLLKFFEIFLDTFWKFSLNVVENVAKVEIQELQEKSVADGFILGSG